MTTPHKCPCCDGFGVRDSGKGSMPLVAECHACSGSGILWESERIFDGRRPNASIESCTVDSGRELRSLDDLPMLAGYPARSWLELQEACMPITSVCDPSKQAQGLRDRIWRMKGPT